MKTFNELTLEELANLNEWWEYKELPKKPKKATPHKLIGGRWDTLKDINDN